MKRFKAPRHRWGSILGVQEEGMTVVQPTGRRFRVPKRPTELLLQRLFVTRYLYGGLRPSRRCLPPATAPASPSDTS